MSSLGFHKDSLNNLSALMTRTASTAKESSPLPLKSPPPQSSSSFSPSTNCVTHKDSFDYSISSAGEITDDDSDNSDIWGFQDYYDDMNDYHDPYAIEYPPLIKKKGGLFGCFFPWCGDNKNSEEECQKASKEEDDAGRRSGIYSQKCTSIVPKYLVATKNASYRADHPPKIETAAVADIAGGVTEKYISTKQTKPILELPLELRTQKPTKSVLKKTINTKTSSGKPSNHKHRETSNESLKRHLFPTKLYKPSSPQAPHLHHPTKPYKKKLRFSPMAAVINIQSRHEMPLSLLTDIWWQKSDFEDFKKTGRVIARAILTGGSEIWLQYDGTKAQRNGTDDGAKTKRSDSSLTSTDESQDEEYVRALEPYRDSKFPEEEHPQQDYGPKWWCQFGHSRRGLEHICNMQEGTMRQRSVAIAVSSVLSEQNRQHTLDAHDPERLANVYIHKIKWATKLGIATAKADEDAVNQQFRRINVRSRSFFLEESGHAVDMIENHYDVNSKHLELLEYSLNRSKEESLLDANTKSALYIKKMQSLQQRSGWRGVITPKKAAQGYGPKEEDGIDSLLLRRGLRLESNPLWETSAVI